MTVFSCQGDQGSVEPPGRIGDKGDPVSIILVLVNVPIASVLFKCRSFLVRLANNHAKTFVHNIT